MSAEPARSQADFYTGRRVLVTGGTGMIGRQVVDMLLALGARVRVASLDDPALAPAGVDFMGGNLTDWDFCRAAVKGIDYVFHLAGIKGSVGIGRSRGASFFVPLLLMNTLMMEAARQMGVGRYLYTSSIAVYHPADVFVEDRAWDGPPHPTDRFAAWAKRMGELQAEAYREEFGWGKVAIVRPSNVYGPYDNFDPQTAMVIPALIARVFVGEKPLVVWGDGSAVRDFIFSRDCAQGMLLALQHGTDGRPINLGSGRGATIREVVEAIVACADDPPEVVWDASKPPGQPMRLMDVTRAREVLGFESRTPLVEGIRATVEWYRENPEMAGRRLDVFRQADYMRRVAGPPASWEGRAGHAAS